ncbi:hypothetical protein GCM10007973_28150 [Polymorphobacter multimanifer]|nr:hypothetical protein GCM10007973_28150 [Polymorphobacter multimanifer]
MRNFSILAAVAAVVIACPAAAAQFTFDFSPEQTLFGRPVSGSGIFTTSGEEMSVGGRSAFAITGITGFVNGSAIAPVTGNFGNFFTSGDGFLDGSGIRFFTESGIDVRFFQQSSNGRYRVNTFGAFGSSNFVSASATAVGEVPEPASWAMMIIGSGLIGGAMRYRRRTAAVALA